MKQLLFTISRTDSPIHHNVTFLMLYQLKFSSGNIKTTAYQWCHDVMSKMVRITPVSINMPTSMTMSMSWQRYVYKKWPWCNNPTPPPPTHTHTLKQWILKQMPTPNCSKHCCYHRYKTMVEVASALVYWQKNWSSFIKPTFPHICWYSCNWKGAQVLSV